MEGIYKIAGHTLKVISLHSEVHDMCRDYAFETAVPEIVISASQSDIEAEREECCADSNIFAGVWI
ncbi:MAG: hypothetical protein MRZ59_05395 [Clostridiales bacterium]|nr:hypothetical protein [Clostridiales bacterium]MDY3746019.1 hypothetical protein [Lachnospiraceae bacterium]